MKSTEIEIFTFIEPDSLENLKKVVNTWMHLKKRKIYKITNYQEGDYFYCVIIAERDGE